MMGRWKGKLKRLREEKQRTGKGFWANAEDEYSSWKAKQIGKLIDTQIEIQQRLADRKEKKDAAQHQIERIKYLEKKRRTNDYKR